MKPEENPEEYLLAAMERQAKRMKSWIEDSMWIEPCAGRTWRAEGLKLDTAASKPMVVAAVRKRKPPSKGKTSREPKTFADVARMLERRKK
jgi:hypothetical protein